MGDFQLILLFALLFGLASVFDKNRTYLILFLAAILNLVLYPFTTEYSATIEGGLDALTVVMLTFYGGRHKLYQMGLLCIALFMNLQFELDQANATNLIFSNYGVLIIGITIMQLFGVGYGVSQRIWQSCSYSHLFANGGYLNRCKVCPKD